MLMSITCNKYNIIFVEIKTTTNLNDIERYMRLCTK